MDDDKRKVFRVGFFVTVEVDSFHESEAAIMAEAACGWPGSWSPAHDPIPISGVINGHVVTARIIRSQAMMVSPAWHRDD